MTAILTTLATLTVLLGLLVLWLLWDRAEQRATVRALEAAVVRARAARNYAIADRDTARRHRDEWRETAETYQRMAEDGAEADLRLAYLRYDSRILPDLRDPDDLPDEGPGDTPIHDELARERAA